MYYVRVRIRGRAFSEICMPRFGGIYTLNPLDPPPPKLCLRPIILLSVKQETILLCAHSPLSPPAWGAIVVRHSISIIICDEF